jgi:hypothetical protein
MGNDKGEENDQRSMIEGKRFEGSMVDDGGNDHVMASFQKLVAVGTKQNSLIAEQEGMRNSEYCTHFSILLMSPMWVGLSVASPKLSVIVLVRFVLEDMYVGFVLEFSK